MAGGDAGLRRLRKRVEDVAGQDVELSEAMSDEELDRLIDAEAQAGVRDATSDRWIPACAGMTSLAMRHTLIAWICLPGRRSGMMAC